MTIASTFTASSALHAAAGGVLIGLAAFALLFSYGRIAGISGIFGRLPQVIGVERAVSIFFLGGLVLPGLVARFVAPELLGDLPRGRGLVAVAIAGLLVGYGTRMANGCTSGHGVCGLARTSVRSLVAVVTFIGAGVVMATLVRLLGGAS